MGLFRRNEARAHPDAHCAERQRCGKPAPVIDATGRDHRNIHRFNCLRDQRQRADQPRMPAAFAALQDHRVAPGLLCLDRMLYGAANNHHLEAGLFQLLHDRHRHAEARHEAVRAAIDDDIDRLFEALRRCGQKVDTERLVGELAHLLHLAFDEVRRGARHAKHAIATRIAHRGGQFGIGDAAHSGQHDRVFDAQEVAKRGVDAHQCPPVIFSDPCAAARACQPVTRGHPCRKSGTFPRVNPCS